MKNTLFFRLQASYPESSKNTLKKWVVQKRVLVNGKAETRPHRILEEKDVVELDGKKTTIKGCRVFFQDEDLIVIHKPRGLLSVAQDVELDISLHRILKEKLSPSRVYPVHRLDRATSGVLVFALSETARDHLKAQFEEHSIHREYMAWVTGCPEKHEGTWTHKLSEAKDHTVFSSNKGKEAITHYKVLKEGEISLLRLTLETGRKNQLRVQCMEAGHPIVGDRKYGSKDNRFKRLALHAKRLEFTHPISGQRMRFVDEKAVSMPLG
ncbi:MAG: hypothetical protein SP1CHLAM54_07460 [Chlamydiia bacterium]|nr:hypothetical protein [Chlamydiia bacterium]MCH9615652.1 hypothetical protein [Chlamydiia bacterium]MCH9628945.1 hypothetical protein [Chlamydiia bacterium]